MNKIKDWNDKYVSCAYSKGGVCVLSNPFDNLIKTGCNIWPTPEIVQKLYKSRHISAFSKDESEICESGIGYYNDLQSLNSEDAITWSVFGTLSRSNTNTKNKWVNDFFRLMKITDNDVQNVEIFLWRRIPHPDTLVSGGPEIDIGIFTSKSIILCEAKWLSGIGKNQGKMKNKNQIQLRKEYLTKYGKDIFTSASNFITLTIGIIDNEPKEIDHQSLTWDKICNLSSHPAGTEVKKYYNWKVEHSKIKKGVYL